MQFSSSAAANSSFLPPAGTITPQETPSEDARLSSSVSGDAIHILLIEDNPGDIRLVKEILRSTNHASFHLSHVPSLAAAAERLAEQPPDLILLDLSLPDGLGVETFLRCREFASAIPIVVLSGSANEAVAVEAVRLGAQDYLVKSLIDGDLIARSLRYALARHRAEAQTRASEQFAVATLNALSAHIAILDENGAILAVNKAWNDYAVQNGGRPFLASTKSTAKINYLAICEASSGPCSASAFECAQGIRAVMTGQLDEYAREYPCHSPDEQRWFLWRARRFPDSEPVRVVIAHEDITARVQSEIAALEAHKASEQARLDVELVNRDLQEAMRRANELMASAKMEAQAKTALLEALPSILISMDDTYNITQWNPAAEATFGLTALEVIGQSLEQFQIFWVWARVVEGLRKCKSSLLPASLEDVPFTRLDGTEGFLGITITPLKGIRDEIVGFLLLGADVTRRKLLETQIVHAQKMESIGQLAAGIAHEINTPIQYIGDNARFLEEGFGALSSLLARFQQLLIGSEAGATPPGIVAEVEAITTEADLEYLLEEMPKAISQSLDGVARVSRIVQAMKHFSHPGTTEKTPLDINRAIDSTLTVARNEWKYAADVTTDFDPNLPLVPCLPGDFSQVILNLIVNAAHAIADVVKDSGDKGLIVLSTRREGDWAEIRVRDTGTGIPSAARSRIFDPFFTTKEVGRGTGQGLSIAHSIIVEKHGGEISFDTETGKGTTFLLRLPLQSEEGVCRKAA